MSGRRPDFRFMRAMVRERIPEARFMDWLKVRERYPYHADELRQFVQRAGETLSRVLFYEHDEGVSVALPPRAFDGR